ncbi:3-oxo-5-alpha-steroid 4-dehydrogenase 1 [Durusdinium trenchii]|uniref:3-oxo-5-alpha-steroid 4-dehydrogenase 1 n=1 Tax=Durusdinium trenchii TaxID=1381693 RepID=A0ABP0HHE8_9DINO
MGTGASALLPIVRDGFLIQVGAWAIAASLQTEKFYDLTGSLTFIYLTTKSFLSQPNQLTRNKVNSGLVLLWAGRLGSFLFARVMRDGKDRRFDKADEPLIARKMRRSPVQIINTDPVGKDGNADDSITSLDMAAWALWGAAFLVQVTADRQKTAFRAVEANKDKFITSGVWAYSQHPNYAAEMVMWSSLWLSCSSQMQGAQLASFLCPLFNMYLLRYVSGVPLLQKHAKKAWGNNPAWVKYTAETPLLFPVVGP